MFFRDLWRIAGILHKEVLFRSSLSMSWKGDVERIARYVSLTSKINKLVLAAIVAASAYQTYAVPKPSIFAISVAFIMFMLIFFGTNFAAAYYAVDFSLLHTLPIEKEKISKLQVLTFFRIFDFPVLVAAVAIPLSLLSRSISSALHALAAILIATVLSLAITLYVSKRMYAAIYSPSPSPLQSIFRIVSVVSWAVVIYGFYMITRFISYFTSLGESIDVQALAFLFPFNFAVLVFNPNLIAYLYSIPYGLAAVYSLRWMSRELHMRQRERVGVRKQRLKIRGQSAALVIKDLRLISRNPGLMFLLILPIIESILLSLTHTQHFAPFSVVIFTSLAAYAFMSVDTSGYSLLLPLDKRKLLSIKSIEVFTLYIISAAIMTAVLFFKGEFSYLTWILTPTAFAVAVLSTLTVNVLGIDFRANPAAGVVPLLVATFATLTPAATAYVLSLTVGVSFEIACTLAGLVEASAALVLLAIIK